MRREFFNEEGHDDPLKMNLDCLNEVRTEASQRMVRYQQKMAGYYNQRVKLRRFNIGDLLLRKVTLSTKNPTQGKLGPTWEGPYKITTTQDKEAIIWNPWMGINYLIHGTLNTSRGIISRCKVL